MGETVCMRVKMKALQTKGIYVIFWRLTQKIGFENDEKKASKKKKMRKKRKKAKSIDFHL